MIGWAGRTAWLVLACLLGSGLRTTAADSDTNAVDLRPIFKRYALPTRLQEARPTCSAFTVAGALEFAVAKRQGSTPRLSVEFLNWAANTECGDKEDGGFFSDLWRGFAAHGICQESAMPYQAAFVATNSPGPEAKTDARTRRELGLRLHWIKEWNVRTGLTDAHVAGIKRTLASGWPVCVGSRWPRHARWDHDILQMCPADAVYDGHSILLVGYRDDASLPGGGVFIFRNSSGGRDAYMPYVYARAYVNDAAWVDFSEPPKPVAPAAAQ